MGDRRRSAPRRGRWSALVRRRVSAVVWPDAAVHRDASRVAAHEWFTNIGGSDKVAARLADLVDAEVMYAYAVNRDLVDRLGIDRPVVTWRYGEAAARIGRFPIQLFVMPLVWATLDVSTASQIVTSSHSCVNAVRAPAAQRVSYVHTPMRYAWLHRLERDRLGRGTGWMWPPAAALFRRLDRSWSRHVDHFVANSEEIRGRISRAYGASSTVVHPPIETRWWTEAADSSAPENTAVDLARPYVVVAGRLVPYKRPDLAVAAAVRAGRRVIVAGAGPLAQRLRSIGGDVDVIERPDDDTLRAILRHADALLFPGVEDFGMLPVEAQSCGTAVIARASGGALETVIDGVTGVHVAGDGLDEWTQAIAAFDADTFDAEKIRRHAAGFSAERFDREMRTVLDGRGVT